MADTDQYYHFGRDSLGCRVIPNATDKPLRLWMHHDNAMALIVNKKTGDVCIQSFYNGARSGAQEIYDNDVTRQLQQNIFLEQEGEKVVFLLRTDYTSPKIEKYLKELEQRNVQLGGELTAKVSQFPNYEKFVGGEVPVGFEIDLKNPREIQVHGPSGHRAEVLTQDILSAVGQAPSTLPDIESQLRTLEKYDRFADLVAQASKKLPAYLDQEALDLSQIGSMTGPLGEAINKAIELIMQRRPFSEPHLYDDQRLRPTKESRVSRHAVSEMLDFAVSLSEPRREEFKKAMADSFPEQVFPFERLNRKDYDSNTGLTDQFLHPILDACGDQEDPLAAFIRKVKQALPPSHPFQSYQYRNLTADAQVDQVIDTLSLLRDRRLPPLQVAALTARAADEALERLLSSSDGSATEEIYAHAAELVHFAVDFTRRQPDPKVEEACMRIMMESMRQLFAKIKGKSPPTQQPDTDLPPHTQVTDQQPTQKLLVGNTTTPDR